MRSLVPWMLLLMLLVGCAEEKKPRQLTERERQEAIAKSVLPGGAVVGRALVVSDSAAARAQHLQAEVDQSQQTP